MKYQELLILLPCHSLEDFPTYHEGEDAQGLLAAWSAMWHPELLANAGQAPTWKRIEDTPTEVKDRLIVVPSMCASRLPTGFAQRVKAEGGCLVRKTTSRDEAVAEALAPLGERTHPVDPDLAADFLALGYAYLQIQLLTRQMRYSSNLDEVYFKGQAVGAAVAAVEGNEAVAREKLSACFSVLAEERDHYYPVDAFILDLNLTAATTLGATLREELTRETATSVLLSAAMLEEMRSKEPQSLQALQAALAAGRVGLIGGEAREERLPLLSNDSIVADLRCGLARYQELLGKRPEVFGRWRFGLTPNLPGLLTKLGFRGALHASFEEGTIPAGTQFKVRWEGLDGTALDSITRTPLDASKPQTFLSYATKMGESMDSDHVATLCLAHWPGQASPWLEDLRRIARYCSALGKFVTVDEYFAQTDLPGHLDRYEADRYKSPYLKQAIIRKAEDPISTSVRYWQRQGGVRAREALETLAALVVGRPFQAVHDETMTTVPACEDAFAEICDAALEEQVQTRLDAAAEKWAGSLAGNKNGDKSGLLVLNPCSFVRRIGLETTDLPELLPVEKPVYAADAADKSQLVVDVPPMGFVWVPATGGGKKDAKPLLLAEDNTLRNEFFEAIINPNTGTLAAMHEYKARGNRMSQQLALRMPGAKQKPGDTYRDPDETARYSVMAADSMEVTIATTALGEITTRGRLLDLHGGKLAGFVQKYRVWRGSRVLQIEIELDPVEEPKADPWNSYFCCRFAWSDETSELFRTANETRQPASGQRFEAPHYVELVGAKNSTTILTGGLPFHRRHEHRMLDSLLVTRGERQRNFRVGIGIDLTHPMLEAVSLLTPSIVVPRAARPASGTSGWLFHLDSRNVIATSWQPLVEMRKVTGFRTRLLETAGRPANLSLSAFRAVGSAERVDFFGKRLDECKVEEGKIKLDMAAHEFVEIVGRW